MKTGNSIRIKTQSELAVLREAGKILAEIVAEVPCSLKSGITTKEVDIRAEGLIRGKGVIPAFKGYRGFPACVCVSVNDEVVHGIPGNRVLQEGEILSIDVGVEKKGYFGDAALTVAVGNISEAKQKLMDATEKSLYLGIEQAVEKNRLGEISYAIQNYVEAFGFGVVRDLCGHGCGRFLHEEPQIPNYGKRNSGPLLKNGMTLLRRSSIFRTT